MAIRSEKTLDDFKKKPDVTDRLFQKKAVQKDNELFELSRSTLFMASICISIGVIIFLYCISPFSKVRAISIVGNNYLTKEYVEQIVDVDLKSIYYLVFPKKMKEQLLEEPFIESCDVELLPDRLVRITIQEKQPYGYRFNEENVPYMLFTDDTQCELKSAYMNVISRVPLVVGFYEQKQTHLLSVGFEKVEPKIIENISCVTQYRLPFNKEEVRLEMRDGMYFFSSYFALDVVNTYYEMVSFVQDRDKCFFADGSNNTAVYKACPWDEKPVEREYWMKEDGSYIKNRWGDNCVKHYYKDDKGKFYLDDEQQKILIPIDKHGNDIVDRDFYDHYTEGWYATGELVIPEEVLQQRAEEEAKRLEEEQAKKEKEEHKDSNKDEKKDNTEETKDVPADEKSVD